MQLYMNNALQDNSVRNFQPFDMGVRAQLYTDLYLPLNHTRVPLSRPESHLLNTFHQLIHIPDPHSQL